MFDLGDSASKKGRESCLPIVDDIMMHGNVVLVASREEDGARLFTVALKPIAVRRVSSASEGNHGILRLTEHDFRRLETPNKIPHGLGDRRPTCRLREEISPELGRGSAEASELEMDERPL